MRGQRGVYRFNSKKAQTTDTQRRCGGSLSEHFRPPNKAKAQKPLSTGAALISCVDPSSYPHDQGSAEAPEPMTCTSRLHVVRLSLSYPLRKACTAKLDLGAASSVAGRSEPTLQF
jgi:hypothetical protein